MQIIKKALVLAGLFGLASCTTGAGVDAPDLDTLGLENVDPLPGAYAVAFDQSFDQQLHRVYGARREDWTPVCPASIFELDLRTDSKDWTEDALKRALEKTERVETPPTRAEMQDKGLAGAVTMSFDFVYPEFRCYYDGLTPRCIGQAEMGMTAKVALADGRSAELPIKSGLGQVNETVVFCPTAGSVAGDAVEKAFQDTMKQLVQGLTQDPGLR